MAAIIMTHFRPTLTHPNYKIFSDIDNGLSPDMIETPGVLLVIGSNSEKAYDSEGSQKCISITIKYVK